MENNLNTGTEKYDKFKFQNYVIDFVINSNDHFIESGKLLTELANDDNLEKFYKTVDTLDLVRFIKRTMDYYSPIITWFQYRSYENPPESHKEEMYNEVTKVYLNIYEPLLSIDNTIVQLLLHSYFNGIDASETVDDIYRGALDDSVKTKGKLLPLSQDCISVIDNNNISGIINNEYSDNSSAELYKIGVIKNNEKFENIFNNNHIKRLLDFYITAAENIVKNKGIEHLDEMYNTLNHIITEVLKGKGMDENYVKISIRKGFKKDIKNGNIDSSTKIFKYKIEKNKKEKVKIDFLSVEDFFENNKELFPYGVNDNDIDTLKLILGNKLGYFLGNMFSLNLGKLTMQLQIHFFRYLSKSTASQGRRLKDICDGFKDETKQENFITTFLACSKNIEIGNTIIELADKEGSEELFKNYASLVKLQTEEGLGDFLMILLSKGEGMLLNAHNNKKGDSLELENQYLAELVKSGLVMKNMYKKGDNISLEECNKNPYFNGEIVSGGEIINANDQLGMMLKENYISSDKFSKQDFISLSEWIRTSLQDDKDPKLADVIIDSLINDLNNNNAKFIFFKNENRELVGVCKIIDEGNGKFYYGTHYLHPDYSGDFSIGSMIQKMLEKEVSKGLELEATVKLDNVSGLIRHIEYSGGIGEYIHNISKSSFIHFTLNSKKEFKSKNKDLKSISDFENLEGIEILNYSDNINENELNNILKEGYNITRIIDKDKSIILEKI